MVDGAVSSYLDCRYGEIAQVLFYDSQIIWEECNPNWCGEGYAKVFAYRADRLFVFYEWTWGTCSGCDEWEYLKLSGPEILREMEQGAIVMGLDAAIRWVAQMQNPSLQATFEMWRRERRRLTSQQGGVILAGT